MLKMSKLTDYAMMLMSTLATVFPARLTTREIAQKTHLSRATVSKLLKILTAHRLLISSRGIQGGYCLANPPQTIFLSHILGIMEGHLGLTVCSHTPGLCKVEDFCHIRHNWRLINQTVTDMLKTISLADMTLPWDAPVSLPIPFKKRVAS